MQSVYRFNFDNDGILNQQVEAITRVELNTVLVNGTWS